MKTAIVITGAAFLVAAAGPAFAATDNSSASLNAEQLAKIAKEVNQEPERKNTKMFEEHPEKSGSKSIIASVDHANENVKMTITMPNGE